MTCESTKRSRRLTRRGLYILPLDRRSEVDVGVFIGELLAKLFIACGDERDNKEAKDRSGP